MIGRYLGEQVQFGIAWRALVVCTSIEISCSMCAYYQHQQKLYFNFEDDVVYNFYAPFNQ